MDAAGMIFLVFVWCLVLAPTTCTTSYGPYNWTVQAPLGSTIEFECTLKNGSASLDDAKEVMHWRTPTGVVIPPNTRRDTFNVSSDGSKLSVSEITERASGVYVCVYKNMSDSIRYAKHGLNLDGALYNSILEKYGANFVTAGSAAGAVLFVMIVGWLLRTFRYRERKDTPSDEMEMQSRPSGLRDQFDGRQDVVDVPIGRVGSYIAKRPS